MASRKSPQTNLRLCDSARKALDRLIETSDVPTTKVREVEQAILEREANRRALIALTNHISNREDERAELNR